MQHMSVITIEPFGRHGGQKPVQTGGACLQRRAGVFDWAESHSPRLFPVFEKCCARSQMRGGANDTGRLFNWHPVRPVLAVCAISFHIFLLQTLSCCGNDDLSVAARQVLMALAFPVFNAEVRSRQPLPTAPAPALETASLCGQRVGLVC